MRFSSMLFVMLMIALLHGTAFAGRPLITDNSDTQGAGRFLIETGFDYSRDDDGNVKANRNLLGLELDYGLTDRIDLTVSSGYQYLYSSNAGVINSTDGVVDTLVELKWRFFESNHGFGVAVKPGIMIPTGNKAKGWGTGDYRFGTGEPRYRLQMVASQDFEKAAFHLNLGYLRNDNRDGARDNLWHASFAAEWKILPRLRLAGNVGIDTPPNSDATSDSVWALGGFVYALTDSMNFNVGAKHSFYDPGFDFSVNSGFSYKF